MVYKSVDVIQSRTAPGVAFTVAKMSFDRRAELMRRIRELAGKLEFLEAGETAMEKMDAALLRTEIDRVYLRWGLRSVSGLRIDESDATPEALTESGPEDLFREALEAVKSATGLSESERKNS